jgi:hypothetical protein
MSLMATIVIVVIVGGIASAFFLLSQIESQQAQGARNRMKAYYLGEAAVEQVAGMIKTATTTYILPNNPADPKSPLNSPLTGVLQVNGVTAQWAFQSYIGGQWQPTWDFVNSKWIGPVPALASITDPTQLHLCLAGTLSILLEPHSALPGVDASNSESFNFTATNFLNLAGVGVGATGMKNYYNVTIQGRVLHYDVAGQSLASRGANVNLTRELEISNQSILPFFAFFNSDLEFLPGPKFVGNGKIHTNQDLYIAGATSIDMNSDYIGANGQMYRHRKDNGSYDQNGGPLTIHAMLPGTPNPGDLGAGSSSWASTLESAGNQNWASQLQAAGLSPTVQQGAAKMDVPPIGSIQPPATAGGKGGDLYEWAKNPLNSPEGSVKTGLILSVDTSGTVTATFNSGSGSQDVTKTLTDAGALTSGSIADNRQSQTQSVPTTNVDVGKLKASGYFPSNGILYATDARNGTPVPGTDSLGNATLLPPPTPPQIPSGFVFNNGATIPGPVNIVSNGPVYMQGDFNVPKIDPNNPNLVYPKQPAAVIADAVNLLSNAWNNTKTPGSGAPNASETSYNFAMVTGQVPTVPGQQYSGGLENLPRFHENWGGVNCNYRGSLINLWTSAIATGVWGQNNVYSPPNRNWDWDSAFGTTTASQVPGFPRAISISRTVYSMDFWGAGGAGAYRSAQ